MKFDRPDRGSGDNTNMKSSGGNVKRRRRRNNNASQEDDGADLTATTAQSAVSTSSTVATTNARPVAHAEASEEEQRQQFQRRARQLAMSVGASTVLLIFTAIPASVLMCLALLMTCWTGLIYTLYQRLSFEYRAAVLNGDGLGRMLLPDSLYDQLVNQSLHEWLSGSSSLSTTVTEYSFLSMYFMPGLTQDTIERHISRLYPRHQRFLNQPGMARHIPVVGNDLMRVLIGQNRYNMVQAANSRRRGQVVPPALPSDDDSLDSMSTGSTEDNRRMRSLPLTIDTQQARSAPGRNDRGIVFDEDEDDASIDDNSDDEGEPEESIFADAITDAFTGVSNMAVDFALSTTRYLTTQSVRIVARQLQRVGTVSAVASMAVGAFGFGLGVYRPHERRTSSALPPIASYFPPGTFLVSTFLASGLTVGIVRTMMGDDSKPMIQAQGKSKDGKKDKSKK